MRTYFYVHIYNRCMCIYTCMCKFTDTYSHSLCMYVDLLCTIPNEDSITPLLLFKTVANKTPYICSPKQETQD